MKKPKLFMLLFSAMMVFSAMAFSSCVEDNDDDGLPYLEVTPETLSFDTDGTAVAGSSIEIKTNRPWRATIEKDKDWVRLSAIEGKGSSTISVSVPASNVGDQAKVTIATYNSYGDLLTKVVTITQGTVKPAELIYKETGGTAAVASPWPLVAAYTNWDTTGAGATNVTYSGTNTSIRSTGTSNSAIGGSGPNVIFFGTAPATFIVNKIALTAEQTNLKLTFLGQRSFKPEGSSQYDNTFKLESMKVSLSANGSSWTDVAYTIDEGDKESPFWVLATANLTLTKAVSELYVRFTASESSIIRLDDVTLTTGNGGQSIDLDGGVTPPEPTDALFYEDFGAGEKVDGNWAYIDKYNDFSKSGPAFVAATTYTGASASVRTNSYNSAPVPPFSGTGHVWLPSAGGSFVVSKLALTAAQTKLRLALGVLGGDASGKEQYDPSTNNLKVEVSANGSTWVALAPSYQVYPGETVSWTMATADFTLKNAVADFYVRISGSALRIDDLKLTEGDGGTQIELPTGGGGELPAVTLPTSVVTTFTDTFETVENKKLYTSADWGFYSNDPAYPADPNFGWMGGTFNNATSGVLDKYIQIAPYKSTLSEVVAYAVMAPFNVKAAADKKLSLSYAWFYQTADNSKLEVVVSTTATNANAREAATWTAVKNLTFDASHPKNEWVTATVDLSSYAAAEKLYVALRYTGKANTYRVDDVKFDTGTPTTPEITSVDPSSLSFEAAGGTKTVAVTVANQGANALSVSGLSGILSATVNGTTVTVTAAANTGAAVNQIMTISVAGGNSKTVPVSVAVGGVAPGTTFTMTAADIVAGKTGAVELGVNAYGSQLVATPSTWYTWAFNSLNFTGARICVATAANGGGIQVQGNASAAASQGRIANVSALTNIQSVELVLKVVMTSTFDPAYNMYAGSSANPSSADTKIAGTSSVVTEGNHRVYTQTFDFSGGNYSYFNIMNNLVGALYIDSIKVTYKP